MASAFVRVERAVEHDIGIEGVDDAALGVRIVPCGMGGREAVHALMALDKVQRGRVERHRPAACVEELREEGDVRHVITGVRQDLIEPRLNEELDVAAVAVVLRAVAEIVMLLGLARRTEANRESITILLIRRQGDVVDAGGAQRLQVRDGLK